ncbi:MAG: hypothetical protein KatS3mg005_4147 [Bryobacteraceae bacterium]|nr:MAG: hypothetical protein KatS3mg005_4147 [Bryobacteraceae bacterium]
MNWLLNLFRSLARFFTTKAGFESFRRALPAVKAALPYIELAAAIVSGREAPPPALARQIEAQYPHLFPASIPKTDQEIKLLAVAVATELMRVNYRHLTTNELRKALELAYADYKALKGGAR